jgi:hypothetical protein
MRERTTTWGYRELPELHLRFARHLDLAHRLHERQHGPAHGIQRRIRGVRSRVYPLGGRCPGTASGGARYERQVSAPNAAATGYAYDNPCYAPSVPGVSSCTFSSGGRTLSFEQNGGKRSQAMLAMDAIFHF